MDSGSQSETYVTFRLDLFSLNWPECSEYQNILRIIFIFVFVRQKNYPLHSVIGPLGQLSHRVTISICLYFCDDQKNTHFQVSWRPLVKERIPYISPCAVLAQPTVRSWGVNRGRSVALAVGWWLFALQQHFNGTSTALPLHFHYKKISALICIGRQIQSSMYLRRKKLLSQLELILLNISVLRNFYMLECFGVK